MPSRRRSARCSGSRRGCCPDGRRRRAGRPDRSMAMLLVWAAGLTVLAGLFAMTDSALSRVSAARALEMAREGVRGAGALHAAASDVARHLNLLLLLIGNAVTPGRGFRDGPFATTVELRELVDLAEQRGVVEHGEREMIHSVFSLGDTIVREVMVPRTEMVWIEADKTVRQALALFMRSGFSRIPVIGENVDDVLGIIYLKDAVRAGQEVPVSALMRSATFVPEFKPVDDLLREMQAARTHIAIVVDEYGGTAGLVTIEDILEEIVGEITDEYDVERPPVEQLADGSVRISARYSVEDLQE